MPSALVRPGGVLLAPSSYSPFATCSDRWEGFRHGVRRARSPGCLRNSIPLGLACLSSRRHAPARRRRQAAAKRASAPLPTTPSGAYHVRREAPPMGGLLKLVVVVLAVGLLAVVV